jgi:hypothetical protein
MEHDAVRLARRRISRVVSIAVAGLAATAFTTMPALAATSPQLIISTSSGKVYTVGPSSSDDCQNTPAGTSAYTSDSPITMLPDGQVWTSVWHQDSNLVNVGSYDPASVNWVSDANPLGPEGLHDVAGLLAISNTWGVATGYYSDTLMSVNFKTGAMTDIGSLPQSPADGLTWATNGDLLMAGNNNYIYRLPSAVLTSALGGTPVKSSDWLNLGDAVTPSTVRWYNPFSWGNGGSKVYGLATGPDGTVYVGTKDAGLYTLAPNNVPTTADSSRALQLNPLRSFPDGKCSYSGGDIEGMTMSDETQFAPASSDSAVSVNGTLGQPISGTVTSTLVQPPATVSAAPGSLPDGVTLAPDGTLSGTPAKEGTSTLTFRICGSDTCVTRPVTLSIAGATGTGTGTGGQGQKPPPADPAMSLPGSVGAPLNWPLPGSAGAAPSTFTVTDPTKLPQGVSIDASGNLMGIPSTAGTYAIPVKACNSAGCTTGTVTLAIGPSQSPCSQNPATATTVAFRDVLAHMDHAMF